MCGRNLEKKSVLFSIFLSNNYPTDKYESYMSVTVFKY